MTCLVTMKLTMWERKLPEVVKLSAEELLEIAINYEQTAKDVGPFDPGFSRMITMSHKYMRAAEAKEAFREKYA